MVVFDTSFPGDSMSNQFVLHGSMHSSPAKEKIRYKGVPSVTKHDYIKIGVAQLGWFHLKGANKIEEL